MLLNVTSELETPTNFLKIIFISSLHVLFIQKMGEVCMAHIC